MSTRIYEAHGFSMNEFCGPAGPGNRMRLDLWTSHHLGFNPEQAREIGLALLKWAAEHGQSRCICPDPEIHRELAAMSGNEPDPQYCYTPPQDHDVPPEEP